MGTVGTVLLCLRAFGHRDCCWQPILFCFRQQVDFEGDDHTNGFFTGSKAQ